MADAAVPNNVGRNFSEAPPGHRFNLYFELWTKEVRRPDGFGSWVRAGEGEAKREALVKCTKIPADARTQLEALRMRQRSHAKLSPERIWSAPARTIAPFVTGLGMEHPVENGFAFLPPYGLPYLPGASVKGSLRAVAERMALGLLGKDKRGWDPLAVWWLFGFEAGSGWLTMPTGVVTDAVQANAKLWRDGYAQWVQSTAWEPEEVARFASLFKNGRERADRGQWSREKASSFLRWLGSLGQVEDPELRQLTRQKLHLRGAVAFWDVLVAPKCDRLDVDILTPHYGHYYQRGEPPHDAGRPIPNPFLVVPAGSVLVFHAELTRSASLPDRLKNGWRDLLDDVFKEACVWCGFGAKTAVGYGQLEPVAAAVADLDESLERKRVEALGPEAQEINALRGLFERDRAANRREAGGELNDRRLKLLSEALQWTDPDLRREAADLIEETAKFLPWSKKKKKESESKLRDLRERGAP